MKVLVVIPAYNEEDSIRDVVAELKRVAPWADTHGLPEVPPACRHHLPRVDRVDPLVIDDHSGDSTLELCREAGIPVVALPLNLGIGGGVQTGYRYAMENGYDIAVQMDGDGQHDPAMLARLLQPVIEGRADMAIGSRFLGDATGTTRASGKKQDRKSDKKRDRNHDMIRDAAAVMTAIGDVDAPVGMDGGEPEDGAFRSTALRRVGIRFFERWILLLSGARITDATSGFRACNRTAMRLFIEDYARDYPEPEAAMTAIRNGLRVVEVPVRMRGRKGGTSSIRRFKSAYYMVKVSLAIAISAVKPRMRDLGPETTDSMPNGAERADA